MQHPNENYTYIKKVADFFIKLDLSLNSNNKKLIYEDVKDNFDSIYKDFVDQINQCKKNQKKSKKIYKNEEKFLISLCITIVQVMKKIFQYKIDNLTVSEKNLFIKISCFLNNSTLEIINIVRSLSLTSDNKVMLSALSFELYELQSKLFIGINEYDKALDSANSMYYCLIQDYRKNNKHVQVDPLAKLKCKLNIIALYIKCEKIYEAIALFSDCIKSPSINNEISLKISHISLQLAQILMKDEDNHEAVFQAIKYYKIAQNGFQNSPHIKKIYNAMTYSRLRYYSLINSELLKKFSGVEFNFKHLTNGLELVVEDIANYKKIAIKNIHFELEENLITVLDADSISLQKFIKLFDLLKNYKSSLDILPLDQEPVYIKPYSPGFFSKVPSSANCEENEQIIINDSAETKAEKKKKKKNKSENSNKIFYEKSAIQTLSIKDDVSWFKGKIHEGSPGVVKVRKSSEKSDFFLYFREEEVLEQLDNTKNSVLFGLFCKIASNPKFCSDAGQSGVKWLDASIPISVEVDNGSINTEIKWELKLKGLGNGSDSRILCYGVQADNSNGILIVASILCVNGLHGNLVSIKPVKLTLEKFSEKADSSDKSNTLSSFKR